MNSEIDVKLSYSYPWEQGGEIGQQTSNALIACNKNRLELKNPMGTYYYTCFVWLLRSELKIFY